jgi:hypothetical protein
MSNKSVRFAELLTTSVRTIAAQQNHTIASVQDELGYALGRKTGGSSIEYWRKGYAPADIRDLEKLARELVKRGGLDRARCEQFLRSAGHPSAKATSRRLFLFQQEEPSTRATASRQLSTFVVGPPITEPRQFFGRMRQLKWLFGLWRSFPLQHASIIGPKRCGKTSLLHYVRRITHATAVDLRPGQRCDWLPQPKRYQWVLVDFQDARMAKQDRLLRHILAGLNLPVPNPCDLDTFMDVVSHQLEAPSVILMDEIGAGLTSPELDQAFWWSLRSLASHHTGGNLAFLLTSHGLPAQLAQDHGKPSPFFNIFQTYELGPFTEAEARELIASSPQPFTSSDAAWILEHSGLWPPLLQILCQARLVSLDESETSDAWRERGLRQMAPFEYLLKE